MEHKTYQYCVAENWGKGFITHADARKISPRSFPGNVWGITAYNQDSNKWVSGVNGTHKTLSEAQAIVDAEIVQLQADYDALPADDIRKDPDDPAYMERAKDITLEK